MARYDFTNTEDPKIWSEENKKYVPFYSGTDALGDYNKLGFESHSSGAQREKMTNVRYDYMPARLVNEAYGAVGQHGAEKYSVDNWMKGLPQSQIAGSLQRHLWEYFDGNDLDDGPKGSGLPHVYHILWNAVALLYGYENKLEDDRFENRKKSV